MKKIWLSSPHMGGKELQYIHEAFEKNWIAPLGPNVDRFEQDLAAYTGAPHVAALSSGTAAIHLALILLGVRAGDEVICQSKTFAASCNPVVYQGATPVFVDSEAETWNMDPGLLKEAIEDRIDKTGKKPKAIIAVHLYGMPAKIREIMEIGRAYDIPVVEDAAESLGSSVEGRKTGSFGDIGILSFNGNKIITTSGGGALLSGRKEDAEYARFLATQAREDEVHYQHREVGYNYRMSNISAGIGRGQMEVLDDRIEARRRNHEYYFKNLDGSWLETGNSEHDPTAYSSSRDICFLKEPQGYFSNRWLTTIIVNPGGTGGVESGEIRRELVKNNIDCRPLWKPMHLQPVFSDSPFYGNGLSEWLFERGLCLPSGSNLEESDLERVVRTIKSVLT